MDWFRWLRRPDDPAPDPQQPAPRYGVQGFAESAAPFHAPPARARPLPPRREDAGRDEAGERNLPFASTGPAGHRARLREKLLERGADALADYEVLEMLLFFAMPRGDTKPLAKRLINEHGSFARVLAAPPAKLLESPGLGPHGASALKLVQAAARRLMQAEVRDEPEILNNWAKLLMYLQVTAAGEVMEHFRVLYLDTRNVLIADEVMARGTVNHTPVYPREVVKRAIELHATALILVHNHPSGDPTPSQADLEMTRQIQAAAAALEIVVHDHLIIGNGRETSFRREGLL